MLITNNINLGQLAEVVFVSTVKLLLFSPLHTVFGRKSLYTVYIEEMGVGAGEVYAPSPGGGSICINYLEFFCMRNNFFYLVNHVYQYICMDIYFVLWVVIQNCIILLFKLFQLWLLGAFSFGSCIL